MNKKSLIKYQIRNSKCAQCRFRNKVRREWCYLYDRRLLDISDKCVIDPMSLSQSQIVLLQKRKNHSRSVSL